ncbi:MAG: hypothetical protein AB7N76_15805 [Planctomycetota bacterium]
MSDTTAQIEAAFHFRGNVTVSCKSGETVEGFLFNRELNPHPSLSKPPFVELFLLDGARRELPVAEIASVALSGEDPAATGA